MLLLLSFLSVAHALYSSLDDVIELTPSNFNKEVIQSDGVWLVEFYAPWCGHCKALAPEWKRAATALKGFVKIGAVDADSHSSLGSQYGVRGFPTIKIFGSDKQTPTDYTGQRTAQAVVDTAYAQARTLINERLSGDKSSKSSSSSGGERRQQKEGDAADVIELTDSNFEQSVLHSDDLWLVEFFAPWCGHCKRLEPEWRRAASELKGKVKLGALDATVHTVMSHRYGVQGFPTIKMFPSGKKDGEAVDYEGGRTSADIVSYALDKLAENVPPPEINQLVSRDVLGECEGHQLCVLAVLPHILDCQSTCRNDYIETLRELGDKYKKKQWGWVWSEAMAQPAVEEALGIGGFGYPALAAINARKMKFALMKGSFSEHGINEFLRELSFGRGSTAPLPNAKMPDVATVDPWDGKDGQLPEEEDIDLSDVELDDLSEKTEL